MNSKRPSLEGTRTATPSIIHSQRHWVTCMSQAERPQRTLVPVACCRIGNLRRVRPGYLTCDCTRCGAPSWLDPVIDELIKPGEMQPIPVCIQCWTVKDSLWIATVNGSPSPLIRVVGFGFAIERRQGKPLLVGTEYDCRHASIIASVLRHCDHQLDVSREGHTPMDAKLRDF